MTNKLKYREFCKIEKDIPIFCRDWWLDSVCGKENWDVALVEKKDCIIASMPYYYTKKRSIYNINMPPLTQVIGPYIKYPQSQTYYKKLSFEKIVMNELILYLPKFSNFYQKFNFNITNWLPFYWNGYRQTTMYSYVIDDLSNLDSVYNNISSNYRNKIRKAQKIVEIKKGLCIEDFYQLNMMVFERQKIKPPYSKNFIIEHDEYLNNNKAREIFYAIDKEGRMHSALYLTWDNNTSYLHMIGEDPNLRKDSAGILLIWEAIKYTKNILGINKFDFEGSMIESVEPVRRSFGAIQQPYFEIRKVNPSLYKTKNILKELYHDLF